MRIQKNLDSAVNPARRSSRSGPSASPIRVGLRRGRSVRSASRNSSPCGRPLAAGDPRPSIEEGVNELAGERLNSPFKELEVTRLPPRLSNPFAVRGIAVYGIGVPGCELQAWQRRFRHKADEW